MARLENRKSLFSNGPSDGDEHTLLSSSKFLMGNWEPNLGVIWINRKLLCSQNGEA